MAKLGLIGGGYWGKNLIRDFCKLNDLHTVCDVDDRALDTVRENYNGVKTTKNFDIMLEMQKLLEFVLHFQLICIMNM